jgi:hypothetical protein
VALALRLDDPLGRAAAALVLSIVSVGCKASPPKDSLDGSSLAPFIGDATLPTEQPVRCGDARCLDPENGGPLGELGCCLPSNACGLEARILSPRCLETHEPGNVDLTCPNDELADGTTIQGCCTPAGGCGLYDRFGELGCIPSDLADGAACRPVPDATCKSVVEVTCDGPEDCSSGTVCCGRTSHGAFDAFGCFASCGVESADRGELWVEICHLGGSCGNAGEACSSALGLPGSVGRCGARLTPIEGGASFDAGTFVEGVGCGPANCAASEKCCERDPLEPYCSPLGVPCACAPASKD